MLENFIVNENSKNLRKKHGGQIIIEKKLFKLKNTEWL